MRHLKCIVVLMWKDILLEVKTREMLSTMVIFSILVIFIFNFVMEPGTRYIKEIAPGILWIAFVFAGVLGLTRSFLMEKNKDCLRGLLLCPVNPTAIYGGKMLSNFLFISIVEAITLVVFFVLFNFPLIRLLPQLALVIFLGNVGFVAVGTLFSAMSLNTRAREIMLPILLFSIIIPVIIIAVKLTGYILALKSWSELVSGLKLLVAFDIIFLTLSIMTFEYIIED
ncbi:MAG: heme exporter protein CcmB [Candidatus Aminicenantales bacterium]